jgi:hypothetical protein
LIAVVATATSAAPAHVVYRLLKDGATWPHWASFTAYALERPGNDEPLGVGAIRVFSTRATCAREQIVELVPDRRLSYVLLSGFPLRDYRGDVDLTPLAGGGTRITWRATFAAEQPWLGWFWRAFVGGVLRTLAGQLARGAAKAA